ncbi:hypothetical protein WUBG_03599 [Wuchereria bancrofti]|uniref:Uncharacterized protein n=1 Tax=Wuchereria bancrofti TaxID=6293 RepID=J9FDP1_WUCBA|nr:hypothetical protein WUBG_03599 [Wuchereria bancrofti]
MNRCKSDKKYINIKTRRGQTRNSTSIEMEARRGQIRSVEEISGSRFQQTYTNLTRNLQERGMTVEMVEIYKLIVIANVLITLTVTTIITAIVTTTAITHY